MEPDCAYIHCELAKKGVNLTLLWNEYKARYASAGRVPYQYTQFCDTYRSWAKKSKATMRIHHKPGDAMEVDWAGGTLPITDPVTGQADSCLSVCRSSSLLLLFLCRDLRRHET